MKTICITCDVNSDRYKKTIEHLAEHGVTAEPFCGFNNRLAGVVTEHTYDVDHPGTGYRISGPVIGIALSHWMVWKAMNLWDAESVMVFEDDVRFAPGGKERLERSLLDLPSDWDVCYFGSCCTSGKPSKHIVGNIHQVYWPMCTHSYAIKRNAAQVMQDRHDRLWAPVDISMFMDVYSKASLNVYTVLPRVFEQHETIIPE